MRFSRGTWIVAALVVVACKTNNISQTNNNNYTTIIGSGGGRLDGPDGTRLVVPPGAVGSDTKFSIRVADPSEYPPLATEVLASKVYVFEPRDVQLLTKVEITLPIRPGASPSPFELTTYGFYAPSAARQGASVQSDSKSVKIAQDALGLFVVGDTKCPSDAPAQSTATIQVSGGLPQGAAPPNADGYFFLYGDCNGPTNDAPSQIAFELASYNGACGIGSLTSVTLGSPSLTSGKSSGSRLLFSIDLCAGGGPIKVNQPLVSNPSTGPHVFAELFVANGSCSTSPAVLSGGGQTLPATVTFTTLAHDHIAGTFTMKQSGNADITGTFDLQPCGHLDMGKQTCCN